jgi:hypothetical protein
MCTHRNRLEGRVGAVLGKRRAALQIDRGLENERGYDSDHGALGILGELTGHHRKEHQEKRRRSSHTE